MPTVNPFFVEGACNCNVCLSDREERARRLICEAPMPTIPPPPGFCVTIPVAAIYPRRRRGAAKRAYANAAAKTIAANQTFWAPKLCSGPAWGNTTFAERLYKEALSRAERCGTADLEYWMRAFFGRGVIAGGGTEGVCNCSSCRGRRRNAWGLLSFQANLRTEGYELLNGAVTPIQKRKQRSRLGRAIMAEHRTYCDGPDGATYRPRGAKGADARIVGIEVEFNKRPYNEDDDSYAVDAWRDSWAGASIHEDGSCGWEAVTPPIAGRKIDACVNELCAELSAYDTGCNDHCGLHVHVDARDVSWYDMRRFLGLYAKVEPLLFVLGGQSRIENGRYCGRFGAKAARAIAAEDWKGAIISAVLGVTEGREEMKVNGCHKKDAGRYRAVNLMPWMAGRAFRRPDTTIEFRLHEGTHDAQRIIPWAKLCAAMVEWAVTHTDSDLAALPKSPIRALLAVSPRSREYVAERLRSWRQETSVGYLAGVDRRMVSVKPGLWTMKGAA